MAPCNPRLSITTTRRTGVTWNVTASTSDAVATGFQTLIETPLIGGSIAAVTGVVGLGSKELSVAQNGLVRSYALALAGGLAILTVVFLAVR